MRKGEVKDHGKPLDRSHCHLCGSDKPGGGHVGQLDGKTYLACGPCWDVAKKNPQALATQVKAIREMRK